MNVVFLVDGREAVPVRALPFVTGWSMSPDIVAESFADPDSWRWMQDVPAYQLHGGTISGPLLPKEWDGVVDRLQALDTKLKAMSDDRKQTRPIWLRKSVPLLPPSVFVWKDQFEAYFYQVYSPERLGWVDERPGDRKLNFSPLISPPRLRRLVLEGFGANDVPSERVMDHGGQNHAEQPLPTTGAVSVTLPHLPKALDAVFQIMRNNWTDYDPKRLPKQVNIAREIGEALGWPEQADGSPSRSAKTLAMLIKPDVIDDTK
jgi:hypothetical protein